MTDAHTRLLSANKELNAALTVIYQVFSKYRMSSPTHASPLHDLDAILTDLSSATLVQLSPDKLGPYASWAMTTVGDVEDYKHFLPRIIHLACLGGQGQPGLDPELIASKLDYANWRNWPGEEQAAIEIVFDRAWARARLLHPDQHEAEAWLCANAMIGNNLGEGLKAWVADPAPVPMIQLAHFAMGAESLAKARGSWALVASETRLQILAWLCSGMVEAALIEGVSHVAETDLWRFDSVDASLAQFKQALIGKAPN